MKKIYMTPSLKTKEIKINAILTGSDPTVSGNKAEENSEGLAKESTWGNTWEEE